MIPDFELRQDEEKVYLDVRLPYVFLSKLEVDAEDEDVILSCAPYGLRLRLPGPVLGDSASAAMDATREHHVVITLPKKRPGEVFADLDLPGKLLAAGTHKLKASLPPSIEILASTDFDRVQEEQQKEERSFESSLFFDGYGFGAAHRGVFTSVGLVAECSAWLRIGDPERSTAKERGASRREHEIAAVDWDRCAEEALSSLTEDDNDPILDAALEWLSSIENSSSSSEEEEQLLLDPETQMKLARVPRRPPPLLETPAQKRAAAMVILDLCVAHTTDLAMPCAGVQTCESARTLCALAAPLGWLETYERRKEEGTPTVRSLVVGAVLRQLATCYIRRIDLAFLTTKRAARALQRRGKRHAIAALLDLREALTRGGGAEDGRSIILLRILLEPAIAWLQFCESSDALLLHVAQETLTVIADLQDKILTQGCDPKSTLLSYYHGDDGGDDGGDDDDDDAPEEEAASTALLGLPSKISNLLL